MFLCDQGNEKLVACGARVRKSDFPEIPVNEGVEEGLQDDEVEQKLRGHQNVADLLESGYSKDENTEIDEGIKEAQPSKQMLKKRKKPERILKRKLSQPIGSIGATSGDPLTIE
ncbi:hypothetical protein L2E82_29825 [Cichorium intybus]|uniref:Uncharacterized protein n=1 Tax=Cichorium intybus TaxID=13427 RepID=A0ACB9CZ16_CICIN|nr:hypothetical protein L2E82_29825 [Cichorium intybus]